MELPEYVCHKRVRAAKIVAVEYDFGDDGGLRSATLRFADGSKDVEKEWILKHAPRAGGYFVEYEDGYQSFSPAKAFELGYTRAAA